MGTRSEQLSERVVSTMAEVLGTDPVELPTLEDTIHAEALDSLFRKNHPPGAYTVFPYCDLWVVAHSTGAVDVFDEYRATSAEDQLPDDVPEPDTDERMVVLHFRDERYTFYEDQLDELHRIVAAADDTDQAWDNTVEYAREQADGADGADGEPA